MIFRRRQGSNRMTSDMLSRACPVTREQTLRPRSCGFGTAAFRAKTGAGDQEWREVIREKSGTDGGKQKENTAKTQTMQCVWAIALPPWQGGGHGSESHHQLQASLATQASQTEDKAPAACVRALSVWRANKRKNRTAEQSLTRSGQIYPIKCVVFLAAACCLC